MSTKKENRLKNSILNLRLFKEETDYIEEIASKFEIKKVELIEALLFHLKTSTEKQTKEIIKKYLTKDL